MQVGDASAASPALPLGSQTHKLGTMAEETGITMQSASNAAPRPPVVPSTGLTALRGDRVGPDRKSDHPAMVIPSHRPSSTSPPPAAIQITG